MCLVHTSSVGCTVRSCVSLDRLLLKRFWSCPQDWNGLIGPLQPSCSCISSRLLDGIYCELVVGFVGCMSELSKAMAYMIVNGFYSCELDLLG